MKLARALLARAIWLSLPLAALSCAAPPVDATAPRLRIRSPRLDRALSEDLPSFSRPADPVKLAVFERINSDRATAQLQQVEWDDRAARVADAFCAQQVAEQTRGHYLKDGIPPYARTGFAGVFGYQSENSISWITTGTAFEQSTEALALAGEREMIEEKPPADGHRKTILDPEATHVGVGYALAGGRFQMAQEFLIRALEKLTISLADPARAAVRFEGKPGGNDRLRFVLIAREPEPRLLGREEASARTSYSYPMPGLAYTLEGYRMVRVENLVNEDRIRVRTDGRFSFVFRPESPGLYTFVFYVSLGNERARPGGSATVWVERAKEPIS